MGIYCIGLGTTFIGKMCIVIILLVILNDFFFTRNNLKLHLVMLDDFQLGHCKKAFLQDPMEIL